MATYPTTIKKWNGTTWEEAHPKTTHLQIIASGEPSNATFLRGDGVWATPAVSGTGDVVGPASSVNDRIAVFNGTTGKLIKDSGTLISGLAAVGHTHDDRYYTKTELDGGQLDNRYYTEAEVDAKVDIATRLQLYPNTKNTSGSTIPKGAVVQFAGSQGDFITIKQAVASEINANPSLLMGLAHDAILNDAFGDVVYFGNVLEIATGSFTTGQILWFDIVNGGLTATEPATDKIQIAAVEKASSNPSATNGILLVRIKYVSRNISDVDGLQSALDGKVSNTGATLSGAYNLNQNPVGTTYGAGQSVLPPNSIRQVVGDNDAWRLYGEATSTNNVRMVFQLEDDLEVNGVHSAWIFRNKRTYTDFTATEPFRIFGSGDVAWTGSLTSGSVPWARLTSVPSSFTPSAHTHGNITNAGAIGSTSNLVVVTGASGVLTTASRDSIDSRASFPPSSHTHVKADITDFAHNHNDLYYTETEVNNLLNAKVNTSAVGAANGVASLDANSKIPESQLPGFIFGGMRLLTTITSNTTAEALYDTAQTYVSNNGGALTGCYFLVAGASGTSFTVTGGNDTNNGVSHVFNFGPINQVGEENDDLFSDGVTLESGDWLVISEPWNFMGTNYQSWAVVNNTYANATATIDGVVKLSNTTTISSSTTGSQVITQGVLGGLIGTAANTIAAGDDARFTDARTPLSHTHAAGDVTSGTFADARIPNLNASKITAGTLSIDRIPTITIAKGGTNITSYAAGDILYASATNTLAKLPKGSDGQILKLVSGLPAWGADNNSGGTVTSVAAGNGMSFTTFTTSGSVAMGTPSTLTNLTTNSASGTTHTHAITTHAVSGTTNQITVTGAARVLGEATTLSLPQNIHTSATPQFARIGLGVASSASPVHVKNATPEIKLEAGSTTDSGTMRYNTTTKSIEFIFA